MRAPEQGVILINVLVVLALTSAVLLVMVRTSDTSIARAQVFSDSAQGLALIQGAEASAVAALRRDMTEGAEADHPGEPWVKVAQGETRIEAGTFAVQIEDAQSRLNLNSLEGAGVLGAQILTRLATRLKLPDDTAPRILSRLASRKPLNSLDQLIPEAGLAPETLDQLRPVITLLPGRTEINLNTAAPDLIFALTDNPVQGRILLSLRDWHGYLTAQDVITAEVILPPGTGFTSQYYLLGTQVTVGQIAQSQHSLLRRYQTATGDADVAVIARSPQ